MRMGGRAREGSHEERPGADRNVFAGGRLDLLADDAAAEAVRVREGPQQGRLVFEGRRLGPRRAVLRGESFDARLRTGVT